MSIEETTQPVALDEDRQQQARTYSRIQRRLMFVDLIVGAAYLMVWLALGLNVVLREWVAARASQPFWAVLIFVLLFGLPYTLISLPMSFYSGFVLPHRFGLSNQSFGGWVTDQAKSLALSGVLGLAVIELIYWLLRSAPQWWWLIAAGVLLLFTVVLSTLAPVLIAPLFYKFIPLDDGELRRRLLSLAERAGTEVKGVYRFDMSTRTKSANAAVMGLGRTRRIVLGDTLLDEFTVDEIETVLAHELAHIVHRDMPLLVAFNSALTLLSLWAASLALRWGVGALGLQGIADPGGLPLLALVLGAVGLVTMPPGNALSRWRERMADRCALAMTGKPAAFADAMTRLANQNLGEMNPERWEVVLFHSHPPLAERVAAARAFTPPPPA